MFRAVRKEDAAAVAALMMQVWLHTYARDGITDAIASYCLAEFTPERIAVDIASTDKHFIVAEVNDALVAVAVLNLSGRCPVTQAAIPELDRLYVQEHFARRHIGTGLLLCCIDQCVTAGASGLWLAVNSRNAGAIAFYESHGFSKIGVTDFVLDNVRHENDVLHKRFLE